VQHHHKDHLFGFTHHHCKYHTDVMRCICMCHNEELDKKFAYKAQKRYFWKREVKTVMVDEGKDCNPGAIYSPSGAAAPTKLSLCRDYSLGNTIVAADGVAFRPGSSAMGNTIVLFKNDRISWSGRDCPAGNGKKLVRKEAEVFTCVKQACAHPKCCDCENPYCAEGGMGTGQCKGDRAYLNSAAITHPGQNTNTVGNEPAAGLNMEGNHRIGGSYVKTMPRPVAYGDL